MCGIVHVNFVNLETAPENPAYYLQRPWRIAESRRVKRTATRLVRVDMLMNVSQVRRFAITFLTQNIRRLGIELPNFPKTTGSALSERSHQESLWGIYATRSTIFASNSAAELSNSEEYVNS